MTAAIDHVKVSGAVYNRRPSGSGGIQQIANNSSVFWSASHLASMAYGPTGTSISENVWTNTIQNGTLNYNGTSDTCTGFTSTSGTAYFGGPGSLSHWGLSGVASCSDSTGYRIYCINGQDYRPNPAYGLLVTPVTGNKLRLDWNIVSNNSDMYDDTGVRVYRSTDNSNFSLVGTTAAHAVTYTDTGLTNNTTYYYKVAPIQTVSATVYEASLTPSASGTAKSFVQRIFVTSTTQIGNLGGLSGADTICQNLANAQSLGGTWKAVLSNATTSAASRLVYTGPFYNFRPVVSGGNQLVTSGSLFAGVNFSAAVGYYETGTAVAALSQVWSNTATNGAVVAASGVHNCYEFTNTPGAVAWVGDPNSANSSSWSMYTGAACTSALRLYCIDGQ